MRKEMPSLNANGGPCTALLLAHIAVMLETHGSAKVVNVGKSAAGAAAFHLGQFLHEAMQAKREGKF